MRRPSLLIAVLLFIATGVRAAGVSEFETSLAELRAAVLAQPLALGAALKAKPKLAPKSTKRVTDPDTWAKMISRAVQSPTLTQDLRVADTDYKVFVVVSRTAVAGQECASGYAPRNAFYVAQAVSGPGGAIYPVRLVSDCVGPTLTSALFALDADAGGFIQDSALYDPMKGQSLDPSQDKLSPAQAARFDSFLAALVRLFSGAP
jgi:hypothetical protein